MKIALIIENSQAAKSEMVHTALSNAANSFGHEVHHYGMYGADDPNNMSAYWNPA
jgi:ribose 5-phosphate isomerase RpiB